MSADSPRNPGNSTGGISCDGSSLGNETQTDSLTADVSFLAVQARHNNDFLCNETRCEFNSELNLVANGGFETPEVITAQKWDVFSSPVSGWSVAWRSDIPNTFGPQNRPLFANLELHKNVLGFASEGDQYAELDTDWGGPTDNGTGEPASVSISQPITTIPGASYKFSFAFAPRPNTSANQNVLEARWGGEVVTTLGPTVGGAGPINWNIYEYNVVATTTTTYIQFTDLGTADSEGTFLDNVKVVQISCAQ